MTCEWFALCDRPAVGVAEHPVLQYVPICERCAIRFGIEVVTLETPTSADEIERLRGLHAE